MLSPQSYGFPASPSLPRPLISPPLVPPSFPFFPMDPPLKAFPPDHENEIQEVFTPEYPIIAVVASQFALPYAIELTVAKKASGGGAAVGDFSVTDPNDSLLFMACRRSLAIGTKRVLLNAAGVPLLCAHRKLLSLYDRWDVYRGDQPKPAEALFTVKRSAYFQLKTSLNVFLAAAKKDKKPDFKIKGNYMERKCTVLQGSQVIAEVKRKLSESSTLLGRDTFAVAIYPGTDYAFIVTLVIIMDEIHREQEQAMAPPTVVAGGAVVPDTGRTDGWN